MTCAACGFSTDGTKRFCINCGAAFVETETELVDSGPVYYAAAAGPSAAERGEQVRQAATAAGGALAAVGRHARRRWRPLAAVGVAALAITGTFVVVNWGGVKGPDGDELKDPEQVLVSAKAQWLEVVPATHVNIAEDAGCFFVVDDDVWRGDIACGGLRAIGTADGHTWMRGYNVSVDYNDPSFTFDETGPTTRPVGVGLVDAGGAEAPDLTDVALPDLPDAPSGVVAGHLYDYQTPGVDNRVQALDASADNGIVKVPGGTIAVNEIARAPQVYDLDLSRTDVVTSAEVKGLAQDGYFDGAGELAYDAAAGEQFLSVAWTFTSLQDEADDFFGYGEPEYIEPTTSITVAGAGSPALIIDPADGDVEGRLLVSVPTDDPGALEFTSDGHTQSLSLTTGERTTDPVTDVWYSTAYSFGDPQPMKLATDTGTLKGSDWSVSRDVTVEAAHLTPYLSVEQNGGKPAQWVDEGEAWLVVEVTTTFSDSDSDYGVEVVEAREEWSLDVEGKAYAATRGVVETMDISSYWVAFKIPAATAEATLSVTATAAVEVQGLFGDKEAGTSADNGSARLDLSLAG